MFELVHVQGDNETPIAVVTKELDAKLQQQMHVRSIASGVVNIREHTLKVAPKKAAPKKAEPKKAAPKKAAAKKGAAKPAAKKAAPKKAAAKK